MLLGHWKCDQCYFIFFADQAILLCVHFVIYKEAPLKTN